LDLEAYHQGLERETEDNHENRKEYAKITKTPYRNLMFNK
jgi:hypothetical protein